MSTEKLAIKEQILNGKSEKSARIALLGSKLWIIEQCEKAMLLLNESKASEAGALMGFVYRRVNKYPMGSATRGYLSSIFGKARHIDGLYPNKMKAEEAKLYLEAFTYKAKA
jgi:hypothetical protein